MMAFEALDVLNFFVVVVISYIPLDSSACIRLYLMIDIIDQLFY